MLDHEHCRLQFLQVTIVRQRTAITNTVFDQVTDTEEHQGIGENYKPQKILSTSFTERQIKLNHFHSYYRSLIPNK